MTTSYLRQSPLFGRLVDVPPAKDLKIVVVIPVLAEPEILSTLKSLALCDQSQGNVEVFIIINDRLDANNSLKKINEDTYHKLSVYLSSLNQKWLQFYAFYFRDLPLRKGGVGMARKIGMDEAVRRFEENKKDGIILSLDADCLVSPDYFSSARQFFEKNADLWSAHYPFEHRLSPDGSDHGNAAIEAYELHLRYFINAQRYADFPFAFQTIGSCIAVTSRGYQKMGGMNVRQAGEDFHFLQKFIEANKHGEIQAGCVYPSGRVSFRVPFGTGKGISAILDGKPQMSYSMRTFEDLKKMIVTLPVLYQDLQRGSAKMWFNLIPAKVKGFLDHLDGLNKVREIFAHTASYRAFRSRFFCWFNGLKVIQFAHYCRDHGYPDEPVFDTATELYSLFFLEKSESTISGLLKRYRAWDRDIFDEKSRQ